MTEDMSAEGYGAAIEFGQKLTGDMKERFSKYLLKAAQDVVQEAKSNVQNNRSINTGTLLASIGILEIADDGLEITVGTNVPYAKYIEYGRGPVEAKNAKALSWIDKDTGKRMFAKKVGPAEPQPFLEPAVISKMNEYPNIVAEGERTYIGGLR